MCNARYTNSDCDSKQSNANTLMRSIERTAKWRYYNRDCGTLYVYSQYKTGKFGADCKLASLNCRACSLRSRICEWMRWLTRGGVVVGGGAKSRNWNMMVARRGEWSQMVVWRSVTL
jgi:hypothetical protein